MENAKAPAIRKLTVGELLFQEGDQSRAVYLVKSGMIRLFLKRGANFIEVDTIRSGQVLGELSFLDGLARSASAEALTEVELVEISGEVLFATLDAVPDWLKALLKTVVGRLRTANIKMRQLEATQPTLKYEGKNGGKQLSNYEFLSNIEFLKIALSILLVARRNTKQEPEGIEIDLTLINQYAHWIMGIATSKIASVIQLLAQANLVTTNQIDQVDRHYLKSADDLEALTEFFYSKDPMGSNKKQGISASGLELMKWIVKEFKEMKEESASVPDSDGVLTVNLFNVREKAKKDSNFAGFKLEDAAELEKAGYLLNVKNVSQSEVIARLKPQEFLKHYLNMQIIMGIQLLNEQKQSVTKAA